MIPSAGRVVAVERSSGHRPIGHWDSSPEQTVADFRLGTHLRKSFDCFFLIFTTFNFVPEPSFRDDILEIESEITKPTAGQSERRKLDRRQRAQPSGRAGPVRRPVLASLVLLRTVDHGLHGRRPRFVELT